MSISMSVEIPMDQPVSSSTPLRGAVCDVVDDEDEAAPPPANARPTRVLISPIVPIPADGGASADAALPPAYTGVLYLHRHKWPAVDDDPGKKREKWLKEMRGWLMVLAVLAASVTYQAGLNPPGGFWQQDDAQGNVAGTPVLQSKFPKRYTVFFYFNSTAFVTSVVIIVLLMNESFYHSEAKVEALEIIVVLDMAGLMGAYIAGCTREVSSSIYIIVLTLVVFLYVVYTAQFLPKLWGLVVDVPFLHKAAQGGALPVPQNILDGARPRTDTIGRTKSAPPR
ncbi:hypothetical protein BDA96_10G147800 [Sorghum bicolor]|uniref:PGG domain-containing protein n=2 Tax=Sorghum bicolor TaxID=4558 RepID=A0A921U0T7_SORBI|nr:uncharacterized protein LOC8076404 [Sorghum bicolor]EER89616.1 hypothetical protein SORBI_3010G120000 [Sorghum bicolor]KAG0513958.1 hypothetical protein BDA96_10G147800 [Sorghum bicolor]|eukprot:XP_002438249.1 uncharacterized protein LOC8076404 [Sorghum bicolor]